MTRSWRGYMCALVIALLTACSPRVEPRLPTSPGSWQTIISELNDVDGLTVDAQGNIFVQDEARAVGGRSPTRVQKFNSAGNKLAEWIAPDPTIILHSLGIAVAPDGTLFLIDRCTVHLFTPDLQHQNQWDVAEGCQANLNGLHDIKIDRVGAVYVTSYDGDTVVRLTPKGGVTNVWSLGNDSISARILEQLPLLDRFGEGTRSKPSRIAVDGEGNVYVSEWERSRIRKLSPNSETLAIWPGFRNQDGMATDTAGSVYWVDSIPDERGLVGQNSETRVRKFNPDGQVVAVWYAPQSHNPIAVDNSDTVYLASRAGDKWVIQKLIK
jgi:outer membrane protein assembly factor BamB